MKIRATASAIPRHRFPVEPWRLVETELDRRRPGPHRVPLRRRQRLPRHAGQPDRGARSPHPRHLPQRLPRDLADPARRGRLRLRQDRPDHRQRARRQADEALRRRRAAAAPRGRPRPLRAGRSTSAPGVSHRELVWTTPAGKRLRVRSERMVSLEHRHLAVLQLRGRAARGLGSDRDLVPAAQPPGRRGRVPRDRAGAR